MTNFPIAVLQG
uniref:Uncharacterized protein n=1 Tax=Anguilla anguilla TaxID=7936 RepID=A0A0E9VSI0_ANGAN